MWAHLCNRSSYSTNSSLGDIERHISHVHSAHLLCMQARTVDAKPRPTTVPTRRAASHKRLIPHHPSNKGFPRLHCEEPDAKISDSSAEWGASEPPHTMAVLKSTNEELADVKSGLSGSFSPSGELELGIKRCNGLLHQRAVFPQQQYQCVCTADLNAKAIGTTKAAQAVQQGTGRVRRTGARVAGRRLKAIHEESHKVRSNMPAGFQAFIPNAPPVAPVVQWVSSKPY